MSSDPNRPGPPQPQPYPVPQGGPPQAGMPGVSPSPMPPAGYPQAGYGPQTGYGSAYPQPAYPQPAYPQPTYPQAGIAPGGNYPQANYPQANYPPAGNFTGPNYPQPVAYGQPSYPQAAYPQSAYPQPAYPQPAYPQPPSYPQQPNYPQPNYGQRQPPAYPQPVMPQAAPIPLAAQQVVAHAPPSVMPIPVQPPRPQPVQPAVKQPAVKQPAVKQPATKQPAAVPTGSAPGVSRPLPAPAAVKSSASERPAAVVAETSKPRPMPIAAAPNRPLPLGSRPILATAPPKELGLRTADEDESQKSVEKIAVKSSPPWLVSMIVHMVIIIVLALFTFIKPLSDVIMLDATPDVWAEKIGEQVLEDTLQSAVSMELDLKDPALSLDSKPVDDPFAAPPQVTDVVLTDATNAVSDIPALSIGLALSGREKGAKSALLAAYGGTKSTEEAVKNGLEWLKRNQRADGSWSLSGPFSGGANVENVTSATAMALLAFQGAGHTHKNGEFKDVVRKGWDAMLKMQNADGDFVQSTGLHQRLYAQAQATIAVCEMYGMTRDEMFKGPAQKAIDFAYRAQAPEGGWRYEPKIDADVSVTGWYVMALQSAAMSGLEVQSPSQEKISQFLDRCQHENGARYAYQPGKAETIVMTAEGLLCRQYLGWKHNDERLRRGVDYLLANLINYNDQNVYYWYYATQVLHHMDGPDWDKWNAIMRQQVPEHQKKTGNERGSWDPAEDRWGNTAGRLYTTCLSLYMLEVYYRHMPLYKQRLH